MENDDLKKELERMKAEQEVAEERQKLGRELHKLKAKKWEREHPRLARFANMFRGAHF